MNQSKSDGLNLSRYSDALSNTDDTDSTDTLRTVTLSPRVLHAISKLPQIDLSLQPTEFAKDLWSIDYFVDQILRIQLRLPSDYDLSDIEQILSAAIMF